MKIRKITAASLLLALTIAKAQAGILTTLLVSGAIAGGGAAALSAKKHIDCTDPAQQTAHPYICKVKAKIAAENDKLAAQKAAKAAVADTTIDEAPAK